MIHNIAIGFRAQRSKVIAIISVLIYLSYAVLSDQRAAILFSVLSWGLFSFFSGVRFSRRKLMLAFMGPMLLVIFTTYQRVSVGLASNIDNFFAYVGLIINYLDGQLKLKKSNLFIF